MSAGIDIERQFVGTITDWLITLPHDLKILYEVASDANLDHSARAVAVGAIIYALTPHDDRKDFASFADDAIVLRLAMRRVTELCGAEAGRIRDRYSEFFASLDERLALCQRAMGKTYDWLAAKLAVIPTSSFKGKRAPEYLDDDEASEFLYEEGLVFSTNYPIDENKLSGRIKKTSTIVDAIERRKAAEERRPRSPQQDR